MRNANKWMVLAVAHLMVVSCLVVGVMMMAFRLGERAEATKEVVTSFPISPPSGAEIARLNLLSKRIDVMQNNLTNAETIAFKRSRVYTEDGFEPRISEIQLDMTQGSLEPTHLNTDVAIEGEGFFHVKVRPTLADGTAYTRNGTLLRDDNGDLVVAIGERYPLIPSINIPVGARQISVEQDGTVTYQAQTGRKMTAGRISLCLFANAQELNSFDGLYAETAASGPPVISNPGNNGLGILMQGYLESSNVDPLKEWAALLRAQQMLQFTNQAVQISGRVRQASLIAGAANGNMATRF